MVYATWSVCVFLIPPPRAFVEADIFFLPACLPAFVPACLSVCLFVFPFLVFFSIHFFLSLYLRTCFLPAPADSFCYCYLLYTSCSYQLPRAAAPTASLANSSVICHLLLSMLTSAFPAHHTIISICLYHLRNYHYFFISLYVIAFPQLPRHSHALCFSSHSFLPY